MCCLIGGLLAVVLVPIIALWASGWFCSSGGHKGYSPAGMLQEKFIPMMESNRMLRPLRRRTASDNAFEMPAEMRDTLTKSYQEDDHITRCGVSYSKNSIKDLNEMQIVVMRGPQRFAYAVVGFVEKSKIGKESLETASLRLKNPRKLSVENSLSESSIKGCSIAAEILSRLRPFHKVLYLHAYQKIDDEDPETYTVEHAALPEI